jgi:hypothetical protein
MFDAGPFKPTCWEEVEATLADAIRSSAGIARSTPALPIKPVSWPKIAPRPRRRYVLTWVMERAVGLIAGRKWLCAIARGLLRLRFAMTVLGG